MNFIAEINMIFHFFVLPRHANAYTIEPIAISI